VDADPSLRAALEQGFRRALPLLGLVEADQ